MEVKNIYEVLHEVYYKQDVNHVICMGVCVFVRQRYMVDRSHNVPKK